MRMIATSVMVAWAAASTCLSASAQTAPANAQTAPAATSAAAAETPNASDIARSKPEIARIDGLWKTGGAASWFAPAFLVTVPFSTIGPTLDQVRAALGAYRATAGANGIYLSTFDRGTDRVRIHLDADGKIDGLFLEPPQPANAPATAEANDLGRLRIDAMFTSGVHAEWFTEAFLAKLPLDKVAAILSAVVEGLGPYQATTGSDGNYLSSFAHGTERVQLHLDAAGKIDSLSIFAPQVKATSAP